MVLEILVDEFSKKGIIIDNNRFSPHVTLVKGIFEDEKRVRFNATSFLKNHGNSSIGNFNIDYLEFLKMGKLNGYWPIIEVANLLK